MGRQSTLNRTAIGVLTGLTVGSLIWGFSLALRGSQANWGLIGFELVILSSAVFGVLLALGRLAYARGLSLICIAGCVFVSAGLGLVALGLGPGEVLRHPLFLLRLALVGGFTVLAVLATLGSDTEAWKRLMQGGILSVLSVGLIAGGFATKSFWLSGGRFLQMLLLVVSLLLLTALGGAFCVGVHLIIRAFELAKGPSQPTS